MKKVDDIHFINPEQYISKGTYYQRTNGEIYEKVSCYDCGLPYDDDNWIDTVLPNKQWETIFPEGKGLLCANCIIKRASKLDGIIIAKMILVFANDPCYKKGE